MLYFSYRGILEPGIRPPRRSTDDNDSGADEHTNELLPESISKPRWYFASWRLLFSLSSETFEVCVHSSIPKVDEVDDN